MNVQAKVALDKEKHPERFCPAPRCLWRTTKLNDDRKTYSFRDSCPGGYCPRHQNLRSAPAPASKSWSGEVIADNSGNWCGNGVHFATEQEAKEYVGDLACRWTLVRDYRVVQTDFPVTYKWTGSGIEKV